MLRVYHSNRLERLFDRLTEILADPITDPFAPELVVTQSQGMGRWLALNLAERIGIAANIRFVLPATFVWHTFKDHIEGLSDNSAFDRRVLAWRILGLLPRSLDDPAFAPLARYLEGARPELRRWQLSRQIADIFDQYLIYRPEMLLEWERGEGEEWQAHLWRTLAREAGSPHRAALWEEFLRRCDRGALNRSKLPERLVVFGIPTLPPAYLELLRRLSQVIEIHLLVQNPCLLYWGDIEDPRNIARLRQSRREIKGDDYYTIGNPLLASLGRQGRDFIDMLHGLPGAEEELFDTPDDATLLGTLQADILSLTDRSRGEAPRLKLDPADRSLQIHACHSPMREVEVLHDQLLKMFTEDPTLRPQEVIVMTPNIEEYAPFVEAVFGAAHDEARRIPYAIADLSRESEHPLVRGFLQLLDAATGRFTASEVLSLLELPTVQARFGLDAGDYDTLRRWVTESGIRWGLDGQSRTQWDLPATDANSWEFGFRRLFLGYALPPEETLFEGVLPYTHVEGQAAVALGRLGSFVERLAAFGARLRGRYTATEWAALLNELIDSFFDAEGDDAEPLQLVREAAANLTDETTRARFTDSIGFDLMRDFLQGQLGEPSSSHHFLTGRITFCAMIPMRSIPFRVVCLLGLGDRSFPRTRHPVGFDKIAQHPRRGDRSRREDDRYLFLEALLSARDHLYVSYVGRNIRDNSALLPSVLVTELLDYVAGSSGIDDKAVRARLVVEHPLQPFSARYFDRRRPELVSYAKEWIDGVVARLDRPAEAEAAPFLPEPLPPLPAEEPIELADLVRFFRHPIRVLLRTRLGITFAESDEALEDTEPLSLDQQVAWDLKEELLHAALEGAPIEERAATVCARGNLPDGAFGQLAFDKQREVAEAIAERVRPHIAASLEPLEIALPLSSGSLVGWIHPRSAAGLLRYRAAPITPRELLDLWIHHLALNAAAPGDSVRESRLVGVDGVAFLRPVEGAAAQLEDLVALYREGMSSPLPFMPAAAHAYAKNCRDDEAVALVKARIEWEGNDHKHGQGDDAWCRVAFRGRDPLDDRFCEVARRVFAPLLASLEME